MPPLEAFGDHYPVLASWMTGAKTDHIWGGNLNADPAGPNPLPEFEAIEETLQALQIAAPGRLDGKRREFRSIRTGRDFGGLQAELAFGAHLARSGVAFDFGAPGVPQPDFVLRDRQLGIELTTKRADPMWDIKRHVHHELAVYRPRVGVTLTFSSAPFSIRTAVRDALMDEIHRAIQDDETDVYCVVRPGGSGQPAVTVRAQLRRGAWHSWPRIYVEKEGHPHPLLLEDTERAIVSALSDKRKRRQGASMPTLLLVDVSDIKHFKAQPSLDWLKQFAKHLSSDQVFAGFGIVHSARWGNAQVAISENANAAATVRADLRAFGRALNLPVVTDSDPSR